MKQAEAQTGSELWERLKNARLLCATGLRFSERRDKSGRWWLIQKPESEQQYRIDALTYSVLQCLDGDQTLSAVWQPMNDEIAPTDLAVQMARLMELGFVGTENSFQSSLGATDSGQKTPSRFLNPVSFVLMSFNPAELLARIAAAGPFLFNKVFAVFWILVICFAGVLCYQNSVELGHYFDARATDPVYLMGVWLVYPVLKLVHEIAHGLAVLVFGGKVNKAGVLLLIFMPVPFVDASESSHFSGRYQRMLVSAAGVMAELFLAALGMIVWLYAEHAWLQDIGFIVALTGSISTLLFNANPLLKFDGYYFLSDWLDIPNLAMRSQRYVQSLLLRGVFGLPVGLQGQVIHKKEKKWLLLYGPASLSYRLFIIAFIVDLVSGYFFWLGLLIAFWAVWLQLAKPLIVFFTHANTQAATLRRKREYYIRMGLVLLVSVVAILTPWRTSVVTEGVLVLPEQANIRVKTDGFVKEVLFRSGKQVSPGEPLLRLENFPLLADSQKLKVEIQKARALHSAQLAEGSHQETDFIDKIKAQQQALDHLLLQRDGLEIRAQQSGAVVVDNWKDLSGRYLRKGQLLGYIYQPGEYSIQTVLDVAQAEALRAGLVEAEIMFSDGNRVRLDPEKIRAVPQAVYQLPDAILGSAYGGNTLVDIQDQSGLKTMYPVIQFNMKMPITVEEGMNVSLIPSKSVLVRFSHLPRSIGDDLIANAREYWFHKVSGL